MKLCKVCKIEKDLIHYGLHKKTKDGHNYICYECRAEIERKRRIAKGIAPKPKPIVNEDSKECLRCHEIKSVIDFAKNSRGRLGVGCYCKPCQSVYMQELFTLNPEKYKNYRKKATQKYRDGHREHWRGLHRINQFNRRNKKIAQSDGSITEEFMKELYSTEKCCWCGKITPIDKRTAEHIIPLSEGGVHGVSNLKMACISCNSSKLNFKNKNNHDKS